ncbi:MAG: nuclear transport factor 2 family protein [Phycisphaerales bacterium]|nr:nuclear transport factor 2 family protein [Phycisphaerales bacterium]MCB9857513.1 nuclear transport factor 2 family protein [Phycisphaerales bacterium]MCB9864502.1 nuclear transport factor 2 family protein [Phycisphaerales bacterium]
MITRAFAEQFASEWIEAWNAHDLDRVLAHYSDSVRFASPFIAAITGDASGTLTGAAALRAYWQKAMAAYPDLRFELIETFVGADSVVLYYRSVKGMIAAEAMRFDAEGRVAEAWANYAPGNFRS